MKKLDGNGQSDLDVILDRVAPDLKAQFLQDRLRIQQFGEHDEVLAVSRYLGTTVILIDRITKNLSVNGQAPDLNPAQLERLKAEVSDVVTRAMQKRRDDVAVLSALDEMPRLVGNHVAKLVQEDLETFRRQMTPEKEGEGRRWPAWIQKTWEVACHRAIIGAAFFLLGALPFFFLYIHAEDQRAADATARVWAMMNKLPGSVQHQILENIRFIPVDSSKPDSKIEKAQLKFAPGLHPKSSEITPDDGVTILFKP